MFIIFIQNRNTNHNNNKNKNKKNDKIMAKQYIQINW